MADSALNDLDPRLRPIVQQWLKKCAGAGLKVRITVTYRNSQDQDEAHAKGLSRALGGHSPHNCCLADGAPASKAFDFALFNSDGEYVTDGTDERYGQSGQLGKQLGLQWGGDWTIDQDGCEPDFDHLQMTNWKTI